MGRVAFTVGTEDPIWHEPVAPRSSRPRRRLIVALGASVVALALLSIAVVIARRDSGSDLAACRVVTSAAVDKALGVAAGPAKADVAENGGPPGATVCNYGAQPGPHVTVFAAGRGQAFYATQKAAGVHLENHHDISGAGYTGFSAVGPGFETFFLLKHGQYVNVLLYNAPPGALNQLVVAAANVIP